MDVQRLPSSFQDADTPVAIRPLLLKPQWMNGLSERLLVSHYENNVGGTTVPLDTSTYEGAPQ